MSVQNEQICIDAHLAIVSHVPYVADGTAVWLNPVEWQILRIFALHFRQVTLLRPRDPRTVPPNGWVRLPDWVSVRPCGRASQRFRQLRLQCGLRPCDFSVALSDVDVVYGRLPSYEGYQALCWACQQGKVTMASLHGDWEEAYRAEWSGGIRGLLAPLVAHRAKTIYQWVALKCDLLFTVGEALRRRYAPVRNDVCVFANYLVMPDDIEPRGAAEPNGPTRILFVGSLSPRKGVAHLIDAVGLLRDRGRAVRLTLVGEGSSMRDFTQRVETLGLSGIVEFPGYLNMGEALWRQYAHHDLLVLPSVASEGCPKVIIEAMAKACPVIATAIGSVPHMIEDGVNGLLVEPGRPQAIVQAVERLLNHPKLRRTIAKKGLAYALEHTYDRQIENVGQALHRALTPRFGQCHAHREND